MMFNKKFVCAIKVDGKILREAKDTVSLPFGAEYSILLKNLNSVRAVAKITIDGQDVGEGLSGFVVNPNGETEISRFVKNMNLSEGNRFKFIERTAKIEDHRGIKLEDGLLRIEFQFEKPKPKIEYLNTYYGTGWPYEKGYLRGYGSSDVSYAAKRSIAASNSISAHCDWADASLSDAGITVPGSISDQKFTISDNFPLEDEKHVMVFKLVGRTVNKEIKEAVTVKTKQKCVTCGRLNKASARFCVDCGTSLTIV